MGWLVVISPIDNSYKIVTVVNIIVSIAVKKFPRIGIQYVLSL